MKKSDKRNDSVISLQRVDENEREKYVSLNY
jgi:hypothetical protein